MSVCLINYKSCNLSVVEIICENGKIISVGDQYKSVPITVGGLSRSASKEMRSDRNQLNGVSQPPKEIYTICPQSPILGRGGRKSTRKTMGRVNKG